MHAVLLDLQSRLYLCGTTTELIERRFGKNDLKKQEEAIILSNITW